LSPQRPNPITTSRDEDDDGYFRHPLDGRVVGPTFSPLSVDDWAALEACLGKVIPEQSRALMGGAFQSAHFENARRRYEDGSGEIAPRTGDVVKRMKQVETAMIRLLDALDYPGDPSVAENADELLDEPPEHPLPRPSANAYVWRQMLGAARLGDPATQDTVWRIKDPERFVQDAWLWGYTARQIRKRWKDRGGQPASMDQFVIRIIRDELTKAGIGFRYTSDPDMSGPAWAFVHLLKALRPNVLTGSSETLDRYIRHSGAARPRRRARAKE
jgi:hypothetical protein